MIFKAHNYQAFAEQHLLNNAFAGLFLDMGLGKTVISLTVLEQLIFDRFTTRKALIIAPKRVAQTVWQEEAAKWDHLKYLTFSKVLGDEKERRAALKAKANIYVINRENIPWLVTLYGINWPFDTVVIDELSSFKNAKSVRFKSLRQVRPLMKRVIGLTGTPAPNSLLDLWSQVFLIDQGKRLGDKLTAYKEAYFSQKRDAGFFSGYEIRKGIDSKEQFSNEIYDRIRDICISMKAKDYLDLPKTIYRTVPVSLSAENMQKYEDFEEEQVMRLLDEEKVITAVNAGALLTKLLQFASGAIYDEERNVHEIHEEKLEALAEIIEAANGLPVFVAFVYQHSWDRITRYFKDLKPVKLETKAQVDAWNRGEIKLMGAHPMSAGHGLNLQTGGHIITWFDQLFSLELYQQFNGRLDRQGQTKPVIVNRLAVTRTRDEDAIEVLTKKETGQDALMYAVNVVEKLIAKYKK